MERFYLAIGSLFMVLAAVFFGATCYAIATEGPEPEPVEPLHISLGAPYPLAPLPLPAAPPECICGALVLDLPYPPALHD